MTKKDYELIASAIKPIFKSIDGFSKDTDYVKFSEGVLKEVVVRLADNLQEENPRFDRIKFLEATGYLVLEPII